MRPKIVLLCSLCACSFGGSEEDPTRELTDTLADAGLDAFVPRAGAGPSSDTSSPPPALRRDAGAVVAAAGSCEPRQPIAGCDPVRNAGCPPLTQCDIDTSAMAPTGRCVFAAIAASTGCSGDFLSQTCPPQFTCVAQSCRKLCYCDDDCGAGACCTDQSGPGPAGAFKLCEPC